MVIWFPDMPRSSFIPAPLVSLLASRGRVGGHTGDVGVVDVAPVQVVAEVTVVCLLDWWICIEWDGIEWDGMRDPYARQQNDKMNQSILSSSFFSSVLVVAAVLRPLPPVTSILSSMFAAAREGECAVTDDDDRW